MPFNTLRVDLTKARRHKRRGAMVVLIAFALMLIFAFLAFTVDIGWLTVTKTQLQNAADSAALGSAMNLIQGFGPGATMNQATVTATADNAGVTAAAANRAGDVNSVYCNATRDVQLGQYQWSGTAWTMNWGVTPYNMSRVTLHRDQAGTGGDRSLPLFFAPVLGDKTANLQASATAAMLPGIGFKITPGSSTLTAGILPIALDVGTWNSLMAGVGSDNFAYNPATGAVTAGSDGILEVDLYPSGSNLMPPGNRGTVDIGTTNNGTNNLTRQILYGLSASDLAPYGGQLIFNQVPLLLDGNPGLSAAIKAPLTAIIGQPRALPIFSQVSGNGANAVYTIVKFVGVRVLDVQLTGSPSQKHVTVQPCPYTDPTVVPGNTTLTSDSILAPVQLIQ
jgi:Flp pilus assembly protein TadG